MSNTFLTMCISLCFGVRSTIALCELTDSICVDLSHHELTSLPDMLPDGMTCLDLSFNLMSTLTPLKAIKLNQLRTLDLSFNRLTTVRNSSFQGLCCLQRLSLRGNQLGILEEESFDGLENLTYLDLAENHIIVEKDTFPSNIFRPLLRLKHLDMHSNILSNRPDYPVQSLTWLSDLEFLGIDVVSDVYFPPGFSALQNLKTLFLKGNDAISSIKNDSFAAFRNSPINSLLLSIRGRIKFVAEACVFCHLPDVKALTLSFDNVHMSSILETLYGLQHRNMSVIDLSGCENLYSVTIDYHSARFLRNICVSKFSLRSTNLQRLTRDAIVPVYDSFPFADCIEDLDLSANRFEGDWSAVFKMMFFFKNLKSLKIQDQYVFSLESAKCLMGTDRSCRSVKQKTNQDGIHLIVPLAPHLTLLNLSSAVHRVGTVPDRVKGSKNNSLKVLDLSYIRISNCLTQFENLDVLETLVIDGNNCFNVSEDIFDNLRSLRHLSLSDFNMNPDFFRKSGWRMFKNLRQLEKLDLSLNNFLHLHPDTVRALKKLKELDLSGNRLQSMSLAFSDHWQVEVLDLSHNMMPTLSPSERQVIDDLQARNNLSLRLYGNPLQCGCYDLDFLTWLQMTSVQLDGQGQGGRGRYNYTCVTDSGTVSSTEQVLRDFDLHWRRCIGGRMLGVTVALFLLLLLSLTLSVMVVRSWTHLSYLWKVMRKARLPQREDFRKDVYVAYADSDADCVMACVTLPRCLTERHGVTLLLRHEEEMPGCVRAETIVEHMDDCWKILLLVTRAFAEDEYMCGFTVHQAQRSITDALPNRVIVLLAEPAPHLPPMVSLSSLLRMVPERNVLHVQPDSPPHHADWDRLARLIME